MKVYFVLLLATVIANDAAYAVSVPVPCRQMKPQKGF
jgi:hypothetical protein